ncbi:amino acid ABC transporter substrate-binding protein [Euzebya pacifica]|nr:amino acid ABC transporter substrate-binding protein [Euzebya pacifica]
MNRSLPMLALTALLALTASACTAGSAAETSTNPFAVDIDPMSAAGVGAGTPDLLTEIIDRGQLRCGVNDANPGFGQEQSGSFSGFDIDYCRALAAAVFDDPDAVAFVPLSSDVRFSALQTGEVDVLIRNTTFTASRAGTEGAAFGPTTFYDGQGVLVADDSAFESLNDMAGATMCVLSNTTTLANMETVNAARGLGLDIQTFADDDTLQASFVAGTCDGWTSDKSSLAGRRSTYPAGPEQVRILPDTLSKEPLGPAIRSGDPQWANAVDWTVYAIIQAAEFGITSDNLAQFLSTDDPDIARFLGVGESAEFDPGLGLPVDFAQRVVGAVGNYYEIYGRHVGPDTPLGLEAVENRLWTDGGLLYAPPYR